MALRVTEWREPEQRKQCQRCGRRVGADAEVVAWTDDEGTYYEHTVWLCWDCGVVFEAMCDAWHFGKELYSSRIQPGGYGSREEEHNATVVWLLAEIKERSQRRKGTARKKGPLA